MIFRNLKEPVFHRTPRSKYFLRRFTTRRDRCSLSTLLVLSLFISPGTLVHCVKSVPKQFSSLMPDRWENQRTKVAGDIPDCLPAVCLLVACLTSQQQASVSQGRICSDNFTCCHTEIEVADQTFYLTQSQYTDTRPTSPSADPITPGAWQGSHWSANF